MTRAEAERLVDKMLTAREAMDYALARQTVVQAMVTEAAPVSSAEGPRPADALRERGARLDPFRGEPHAENPATDNSRLLSALRLLQVTDPIPMAASAPAPDAQEVCIGCGKPWPCAHANEKHHLVAGTGRAPGAGQP